MGRGTQATQVLVWESLKLELGVGLRHLLPPARTLVMSAKTRRRAWDWWTLTVSNQTWTRGSP